MKVILAAWSLGLQAGARGVELPEKKVSGGEREFSYSFVTFKPEVDLHSPLFYVVGTTLLLSEGIPRALKGKKLRLKNILLLPSEYNGK